MKKVIGIIAEYNPFHNGHIYQIKKIKENYPNSIIIVCTSSSFTQRGELSILNKWEKAKVSLLNGVDIVIELPYVYSTQSSDTFAKYGVSLLEKFHINYLCFGSESNDTTKLLDAAKTQINNIEFDNKVKFYMKEGYNYPTSLNNALKELINYDIKEPNDLLAISYIKEIINNNYNIEVFNIKRTNSYHDLSLDNKIVSASNIRNKLLENKNIKDKVPKETYDILKNKSLENKYFEFLKYKIISETDLEKYVDVDEGLNVRIKKYINKLSYSNLVILIALPFTPAFAVNIAAGLTDIDAKKFFSALMIGKLPMVYFWGFIGKSLLESITDPYTIAQVVFMVLIAYLVSKVANKFIK